MPEELEQKLDESINTSVDVKKELAEYKREETLREAIPTHTYMA